MALRQVHQVSANPGLMQLTEKEGYFTWQIRPDEPDSHFMVTQKVEGIALDTWLAQLGPIAEETAVDWLRELIQSADALHRAGFVHQDIKPSNIIFGEDDNQLVLVDLGAIRYIDAKQSMNTNIRLGTESYPVIGTPGYEAPEQAAGRSGPASDNYAIGRTLIHLLTGVHPLDLPVSATGKLRWRNLTQVSTPLADLIDRLTQPSSAQDILDSLDNLATHANHADRNAQKQGWAGSRRIVRLATLLLASLGISLAIGSSAALSNLQSKNEANRLFSQGNQLISAGMSNQAVPILERAIEIEPKNVDIRATLAFAYALSGNIDTAINSYGIALELSPDNPFIRYNLASVYEQVNPQQAIANYQIAAQKDSPIKEDALNNLVRVYIRKGDLDKAGGVLKASHSEDKLTQAVLYKNRGWLQFEQKHLGQALTSLNQSIELDPTRADAYCLMAIIEEQQAVDAKDDRTTCLSLPTPADRPEVQGWKMQLVAAHP